MLKVADKKMLLNVFGPAVDRVRRGEHWHGLMGPKPHKGVMTCMEQVEMPKASLTSQLIQG
jgi:hypothetical protein